MAERAPTFTSRIVGITDRLRPQRHGHVDEKMRDKAR